MCISLRNKVWDCNKKTNNKDLWSTGYQQNRTAQKQNIIFKKYQLWITNNFQNIKMYKMSYRYILEFTVE